MSNISTFIFVRHGQSQGNATGVIADASHPLTEKGIEQARKTGNELKDLGITLIVSSPFIRAQQTAETIAGELGIDLAHIQILDELRERGLGIVEGKPKEHESPWYYEDHETELGIETRQALYGRMKLAIEKLNELSRTNKVLVTGHAISGYFLLQVAAGKTLEESTMLSSEVANADYVVVNFEPTRPQ